MSMRIYRAEAGDLPAVLGLLTERAAWMRERGSLQWSGDLLAPERIEGIIAKGGTYLVTRVDGTALGTITLSRAGDPDFWTDAERTEPAVYVSKMATSLEHGRGLGAPMLAWAVHQADWQHALWARLDVYRDPSAASLRAWYAAQGFEYLRDAVVEGKNSGALFRKRAAADPDAALAFCGGADHPQRMGRPSMPVGTQVAVDYFGPGVVTDVTEPDAGDTEHFKLDEPVRMYRVEMDSGRVLWRSDLDLEPVQELAKTVA
jgi:predicted GNAT superfamily acetyltransferase